MLRHKAGVSQDACGSAELAKGIQDSWKKRVRCCGDLNTLGPVSGTVRKCGLVGGSVTMGVGFVDSEKVRPTLSSCCLQIGM